MHRALRARARRRGHSMEAEAREILATALSPRGRVELGTLLVDIGRRAGLTEQEHAVLDSVRDRTPAVPPDLG